MFGDVDADTARVAPGPRARRGPRGFTLLELLITLSVTTIGLVGLLSLHLSVTRGNDGASRSAEAQQIGAATLESLRAQRIADMFALTGIPVPPLPTAPYVTFATGRGGVAYTVTTTVDALTASLIRIRVVTSWTEDGAARGANGGQLDHALPLEVIRTVEDAL
jgi:prepilin-type N-terminal cleavage/methylation domain-containing protein